MTEKWVVTIEYQDLKTHKFKEVVREHQNFNLVLRDLSTFTKKNVDIIKYTIHKSFKLV